MKGNDQKFRDALARFNFRLVIALIASTIFFLGVFLVVWQLGHPWIITILYSVLTLVSALWYIIYNRGLIGKLPSPEELPPTWDRATRNAFLEQAEERRRKSKKLMLILIPMIVVFAYKILEMYVFPTFGLSLSAFAIFGSAR